MAMLLNRQGDRRINPDYRICCGRCRDGLEKIHFFWYAKKIAPLALIGYFGGIVAYIVQYRLFH